MTGGEGLLETVFVLLFRGSSLSVASGQFTMLGILWNTMVHHFRDMSCPSEMVLQWHIFNDGDLDLLQNLSACDEVSPANVGDGAQTALMKALEETYVTAVGDPSL